MSDVLLLSPTSAPGGAERALCSLARLIPEFGWNPHAVLLQDGPLNEWLNEANCPTELIEAGRGRQLLRTGRSISALAKRIRDFDAVISNQSKGHIYGGTASQLARVPEIWWQHGLASRNRMDLIGSLIPSSAVVCASQFTLESQRKLTPRRRTELIHYGIDLAAVSSARGSGHEIRKRLEWDDSFVVGIVGRLQPWKGQDVFLRAAAQVSSKLDSARFCVVGGAILGWEGNYPNELKGLANELGISELTHFAGHQRDIYPWFDALDVVVHISENEPFGLVIVEAMTLGKAVIAANEGGPLEIIEDGHSGLLVPPRNPDKLAEAILQLNQSGQRASLGNRGRARAEQFSDTRMAQSFAVLLESLMKAPD